MNSEVAVVDVVTPMDRADTFGDSILSTAFCVGINLRCNGSQCDKYGCDKKRNHDASCTYANRVNKGGLQYMEDCWMKWLNPRNQLCAKRDGEPTGG